jgi:hypothetical protein
MNLFILFPLLIACCCTLVVECRHRFVYNSRDLFRFGKQQNSKVLPTLHKREKYIPPQNEGKVDLIVIPLISSGYPEEFYLINASIGTPAQVLRLSLTYEFPDDFMPSPIVLGQNISAPCDGQNQPPRQLYNCGASSTCVTNDEQFELFGSGPFGCDDSLNFLGSNPTDTVQFGNYSFQQMPITVVNQSAAFAPSWKADGILNLEFRPLVDLAKNPKIGFYFGQPDKQVTGTMTIGGPDAQHCSGQWHHTEISEICSFCFYIIDLSIGSKSILTDNVQLAQPTLISPDIIVPDSVLNSIVAATNAEYDFTTERYQVHCANRAKLPDAKFTLNGGYVYTLTAMEYARPRLDVPTSCTLVFNYALLTNVITVGTSFFSSHCVLHDLQKNTISFASLN